MNTEELFEALAEEVSQRAARIDCSQSDYRAGLRDIISTLQADIAASAETDNAQDE